MKQLKRWCPMNGKGLELCETLWREIRRVHKSAGRSQQVMRNYLEPMGVTVRATTRGFKCKLFNPELWNTAVTVFVMHKDVNMLLETFPVGSGATDESTHSQK